MSYEFYKILHIFAVLMLLTSLGTVAAAGRNGGAQLRRLASVAHGVALVLILVAGFGLMAKLRIFESFPTWVQLKIGVWLLLALAVIPLRRQSKWTMWLWSALPVLGGLAAWLAVKKPF